jgi:acetyltransferase
MIADTKVGRLLLGARGAVDLEALVDVLVRFSEFCIDFGPALEAVDINPLVVYEDDRGMKALDASILLRPRVNSSPPETNFHNFRQ